MRVLQFLVFCCCFSLVGFSQNDEPLVLSSDTTLSEIDTSRYVHFFNEVDPLLEFAAEEEEKEFKKKKPKKKVFYGIKTKKGYTKKGYGSKMAIEVFYYIPDYTEPVPYVKDVYWFNLLNYEVVKGRRKLDPEKSRLLHGPYKKMVDGNVMESGVFYFTINLPTGMFHP